MSYWTEIRDEQGITSPHWRPWSRKVWERWYSKPAPKPAEQEKPVK